MGWVDTILTVLFVLMGALMTFFILLQEGKGGGLAALGGTKAAGVEGVTNPIRRATGYMAGIFFALAIILGIMHKPEKSTTFGNAAPTAMSGSADTKSDEKKPDAAAPKTDEKKSAPKTDDKKADAPKADEKKPDAAAAPAPAAGDAAKTPVEAPKPADAPKADEKKPEDKKEGAAAPAAPAVPAAPKADTK